jgi:hypothetical protein
MCAAPWFGTAPGTGCTPLRGTGAPEPIDGETCGARDGCWGIGATRSVVGGRAGACRVGGDCAAGTEADGSAGAPDGCGCAGLDRVIVSPRPGEPVTPVGLGAVAGAPADDPGTSAGAGLVDADGEPGVPGAGVDLVDTDGGATVDGAAAAGGRLMVRSTGAAPEPVPPDGDLIIGSAAGRPARVTG